MALLFLASMTVAGGALVASRVIKSKPGGARLFIQRKNIQISHKLGLLDDLQAAGAYEELRRHYAKLIVSKPIVLAEPPIKSKVKAVYYTGGFKSEMTRHEARLVMGLTEAQAKDMKGITKKWRGMMLKNHPDTGGSPFVAAKINEAKEILTGEKMAKEGGEDDEEDGSSALDEEDSPERAKEKEMKKRAKEDFYDTVTPEKVNDDPDFGPISEHPAPPFYSWKKREAETPAEQASPRSLWSMKEDLYHRKATRTKPHFRPWDKPGWAPMQDFKREYLQDIINQHETQQMVQKKTINWKEDPVPGKSDEEVVLDAGHFEDGSGQRIHEDLFTYTEDRQMASEIRRFRAQRDKINEHTRTFRVQRIRELAEAHARARRAAERLKKKMQSDSI